MKKTILMGASLLAVMAAVPALAAETGVKAETNAEAKVETGLDKAGNVIGNAAEKTGNVISNAASKTEAAAKNAYSDVKAYFNDDKNLELTSSVTVAKSSTAEALIGTSVHNAAGKDVGKIHDIIIDAEGDAKWVIIEDGGLLGLGSKLAAFDYDVVEGFDRDKDVVVKLSEQSVKAAKPFEESGLAAGEFSVSKLIGADVIGADGKKIGDVETVSFDGDDAEYLIVGFDKILGLGGDKAALNLEALQLAQAGDDYSVKLNAQQSAQFKVHKEQTQSN